MIATLLLAGAVLGPCEFEGAPADARCATLEVAEDRSRAGGRAIGLRVLVLPATGPAADRAPDPVFYIAGGPGQAAATDNAVRAAEEHAETRITRDVVLVDQRGTGGSNRLPCLPFAESDSRRYLGEPGPEHMRACREALSAKADLRFYTTAEAVADLDDVRRALGYPRVNLDAGSYGTRVALLFARRYPSAVRAMVLRAVNSPDFRIPLPFARAGQDALDRLLTDCETDVVCRADFPTLRADFAAVRARLHAAPAPVEFTNPATGTRQKGELTEDTFVSRVHLLLFAGPLAARIPLLVHQAARGDLEPFVDLAAAFGAAIVAQIDWGMQLSVICTEDVPRITAEEAQREGKGTFLGGARIEDARAMCAGWPRGSLPKDFAEPLTSDVPTLLVSGALDPATPPRFAEEVARRLRRSRHVVIAGGSHIDGGPCIDGLTAAFFARGHADGLDTSCVDGIRRPPFARPSAP